MPTEGGRYRRDHLRALVQRAEVDATAVWDYGFEKGASADAGGRRERENVGFCRASSGVLAHSTRFERATFAFGGQRLSSGEFAPRISDREPHHSCDASSMDELPRACGILIVVEALHK
jgi:hypothetical protein